MSDTESDSLGSLTAYDRDESEHEQEETQVETLRKIVQEWKTRELKKNTEPSANPKGLAPLQGYVANAARLYYDMNDYMEKQTEKEENKQDGLYQRLRDTIGDPQSLRNHQRTMIHRLLERDLIEFPLTVDPRAVNTYTKKGYSGVPEFLDEE
jgi:hypothetical protein